MGYKRNEYVYFVMNKIVNDKQCNILCHVDNPNISHVDPNIVSSFIATIDSEYGKITKMTITRGKIHKYLGMTIDYYSRDKVIFYTVDYIGKVLDVTPEDMSLALLLPLIQNMERLRK